MSRPIDAYALIEKAKDEAMGMEEPFRSSFAVTVAWLVEKMPTIEPEGIKYVELSEEDYEKMAEQMRKNSLILTSAQPEIIRCKDCKYSSPNKVYGCRLEHFDTWEDGPRMYSDDFCSLAERRTDEADDAPSAQLKVDEWCTDCKEYDSEKHCCPRFNKVIRNALKDAQPEPKRGKRIVHPEVKNVYGGTYIECPQCGEKYVVQHMEDEKHCRNCGAKMEGHDE